MKSANKCQTPYCRNDRYKNYKVCNKCKSREFRKNNPLRSSYNALKNGAKRRGKEFGLAFETFAQFCHETNYIARKGITKRKYHIDRIDASKGYTIDNIQVLTCSANSRKAAGEKYPF